MIPQKLCGKPAKLLEDRAQFILTCLLFNEVTKQQLTILEKKLKYSEAPFSSASHITHLADIQDFTYPPGNDVPAITDKEIELAILGQH